MPNLFEAGQRCPNKRRPAIEPGYEGKETALFCGGPKQLIPARPFLWFLVIDDAWEQPAQLGGG
jgi:hypothetical protein